MSTATSGVGSTTGTGSTSASPDAFSSMTSEQFLNVLLTELKQQDPLNPQDETKLLEQLSSIRNIESQTTLTDQLQSLVTQNQVASAGGMIGKLVAGLDDNSNQISGLVTSVLVKDKNVYLQLDSGSELKMSNVEQITSAPTGNSTATSSSTGS